jgi:ethanolamine-phosphate cytidylyltransferase
LDSTESLGGLPAAVYHGPTSFMPLTYDPYAAAKNLGIFHEIEQHSYAHVNAGEIVDRILKNRTQFEARQRAKGVKAIGEREAELREKEEQSKRS